jgi:aspartate carbamoyltransferase catalytic subunit
MYFVAVFIRNLLNLSDLKIEEVENLLNCAEKISNFKEFEDSNFFDKKIACNLFFEASTRTQYSFQVAQHRFGMKVISFNPAGSSLQKEESFYDTVKTFDSFSPDLFVIRHSENEFWNQFNNDINASIINAGDGSGSHPTQSLVDLLVIKQEFSGFRGLTIGIIGDILHSRVANTNIEIMSRLGIKVLISGPPEYMPSGECPEYVPFLEILPRCDIIMMLRIQHERHKMFCNFSPEEYNKKYGLNKQNVSMLKPNAIIMHPGPVNRGTEITNELVESEKSRIFKQMRNGVFVRMAVIKCLLCSEHNFY